MQHGLGSLRGAIGTPDQVLDLCRRYEAAGVDQVIFVLQAGPNRHEHICESLELFAEKVLPQFADGREGKDGAKAERLGDAVERALARRSPPREAPPGYVIDEPAELERAARAEPEGGPVRRRPRRARRGHAPHLPAPAPGRGRAPGARGQRRPARAALRQRPGAAGDLHRHGQAVRAQVRVRLRGRHRLRAVAPRDPTLRSRPSRRFALGSRLWTLRVRDGAASVVAGEDGPAAVRFKLSVADFARLVAEEIEPQELLFSGRFDVEGDLTLAARVPEMFGAPPQF